jgi:quercetin dioxygenase-like cupin family protein
LSPNTDRIAAPQYSDAMGQQRASEEDQAAIAAGRACVVPLFSHPIEPPRDGASEKASAGTAISKQRRCLMRANLCTVAIVAGICTVMVSTAIFAQDPSWRHEIRRLDVPGAPDKQIVVELNEFKPGDGLDRHSHPGIEQGYVIQGAMVQQPGKDPIMFPTGTLLSNMPDVVHGGFKVVGDTSLKAFSVYVVDRNRPLYDWAK